MTHEPLLHVTSYKDKHLCHYLHSKINEPLFSLSSFYLKDRLQLFRLSFGISFLSNEPSEPVTSRNVASDSVLSRENLNFEKCVCLGAPKALVTLLGLEVGEKKKTEQGLHLPEAQILELEKSR